MPKEETKKIQQYLENLGKRLGFHSEVEFSYRLSKDSDYSPQYDVVWFFEMKEYNLTPLDGIIQNEKWDLMKDLIPIAVFEIEGSTTTSKNQLGNFLNLSLMHSFLNFIVVNNEKASNEKDTYRRGVKICRTYMEYSGKNNFIFLDWEYLRDIDKSIDFNMNHSKENHSINRVVKRSKVGGEKDSDLMDRLIEILRMTKITLFQNYSPPALKWQYSKAQKFQEIDTSKNYDYQLYKKFILDPVTNVEKEVTKLKDLYYSPEIDFALVLQVPDVLKIFLLAISKRLKKQRFYYPVLNYLDLYPNEKLVFPFVGIEVESSVNKHLNGGVFNMSNFCYIGLLVSKKSGQHNLNTLEKLGINNVFSIDEKTLEGILS